MLYWHSMRGFEILKREGQLNPLRVAAMVLGGLVLAIAIGFTLFNLLPDNFGVATAVTWMADLIDFG